MYSLNQSKRARGSGGEPIPSPWKALEAMGIVFRRGQLVLVAAGPGAAKSALTLTLTLESGVPSVIISADSDSFTQMSRSIAIMAGISVSDASSMVLADNIPTEVEETLSSIPLRIDYESSPSQEEIEEILEAYWELYGEYPTIIVIDNITNVSNESAEDGDPFSGLEGLMDYLHGMARGTGACVIGLHHVTGPYNDGDKPIPLSGVKGQIARVPEMVLTMHKRKLDDNTFILCVSPVKNRGGKPDATGMTWAELEFVGHMMSIKDIVPNAVEAPAQEWEDQRRMEEELPWQ
jgi:hypothetical protein